MFLSVISIRISIITIVLIVSYTNLRLRDAEIIIEFPNFVISFTLFSENLENL